jgi:hypothetical protein
LKNKKIIDYGVVAVIVVVAYFAFSLEVQIAVTIQASLRPNLLQIQEPQQLSNIKDNSVIRRAVRRHPSNRIALSVSKDRPGIVRASNT